VNEADSLTTQFTYQKKRESIASFLISCIYCTFALGSLSLLTNVWNFRIRIGGIPGNPKLS
jgi:hypothetical protein